MSLKLCLRRNNRDFCKNWNLSKRCNNCSVFGRKKRTKNAFWDKRANIYAKIQTINLNGLQSWMLNLLKWCSLLNLLWNKTISWIKLIINPKRNSKYSFIITIWKSNSAKTNNSQNWSCQKSSIPIQLKNSIKYANPTESINEKQIILGVSLEFFRARVNASQTRHIHFEY